MTTIRDITDGRVIEAYGTSQGAITGWDTRGRGRTLHFPANPELSAKQKKAAEDLLRDHKTLKDKLGHITHKMDDVNKVRTVAGRLAIFVRKLMDWHEALGEVPKMLEEGLIALGLLSNLHGTAYAMNAIHSVMNHIQPAVSVLHHVGMTPSGLFGAREFHGQSVNIRAMVDGKVLLGCGEK